MNRHRAELRLCWMMTWMVNGFASIDSDYRTNLLLYINNQKLKEKKIIRYCKRSSWFFFLRLIRNSGHTQWQSKRFCREIREVHERQVHRHNILYLGWITQICANRAKIAHGESEFFFMRFHQVHAFMDLSPIENSDSVCLSSNYTIYVLLSALHAINGIYWSCLRLKCCGVLFFAALGFMMLKVTTQSRTRFNGLWQQCKILIHVSTY